MDLLDIVLYNRYLLGILYLVDRIDSRIDMRTIRITNRYGVDGIQLVWWGSRCLDLDLGLGWWWIMWVCRVVSIWELLGIFYNISNCNYDDYYDYDDDDDMD